MARRRRGGVPVTGCDPLFRAAPSLRLAGSAFVIVWTAVIAVVLLEGHAAATLFSLGLATAVFGLALAPVFTVRAGANAAGIVVNNGFRTRFVPWKAVAGLRTEGSFWAGRVVVVLHSGARLPLRATLMTALTRSRRRELERMRTALEAGAASRAV